MKKLALALVCLVSVAFFASCSPEGNPTISVIEKDGYVKDGDVIALGEDFTFGFTMASSIETNKELSQLIVYIDDDAWDTVDLKGKKEYTYEETTYFEAKKGEIVASSTIKAIVTDVAGATATASFKLDIEASTNVEVKDITWVRRAANVQNAEEMAQYGLQWTGSYKETMATIKPLEGFSMYDCPGDDFATIKTQTEKAAYFTKLAETQKPIEAYRGISAEVAHQTPNVMLATINEKGEQYLVLFSTAEVEVITSVGTQITITGKAAK